MIARMRAKPKSGRSGRLAFSGIVAVCLSAVSIVYACTQQVNSRLVLTPNAAKAGQQTAVYAEGWDTQAFCSSGTCPSASQLYYQDTGDPLTKDHTDCTGGSPLLPTTQTHVSIVSVKNAVGSSYTWAVRGSATMPALTKLESGLPDNNSGGIGTQDANMYVVCVKEDPHIWAWFAVI